MTTNNPSDSLSPLPLLSEEMERTLRLRAWRDENFREALIADPKGVIQQVFPQWFPNGKVPNNLTIKVIEEDPSTHHIVLPPFPDEVPPVLEIPEEEQLDLIVNMGMEGRKLQNVGQTRENDQPKIHQKSIRRRALSWDETQFRRDEAKKTTPISDDYKLATIAPKEEFTKALLSACKDETFRQELKANPNNAMQLLYRKYLSHYQLPNNIDNKVFQNTGEIHHVILPSLPDAPPLSSHILPEENASVLQHPLPRPQSARGCPSETQGCQSVSVDQPPPLPNR